MAHVSFPSLHLCSARPEIRQWLKVVRFMHVLLAFILRCSGSPPDTPLQHAAVALPLSARSTHRGSAAVDLPLLFWVLAICIPIWYTIILLRAVDTPRKCSGRSIPLFFRVWQFASPSDISSLCYHSISLWFVLLFSWICFYACAILLCHFLCMLLSCLNIFILLVLFLFMVFCVFWFLFVSISISVFFFAVFSMGKTCLHELINASASIYKWIYALT